MAKSNFLESFTRYNIYKNIERTIIDHRSDVACLDPQTNLVGEQTALELAYWCNS